MKPRSTSHSEYGKIESILLKRAAASFVSDEFVQAQWQTLNFIAAPDLHLAIQQYEHFEELISLFKPSIFHLTQDVNLSMDSIYCRDAVLVTDHGLILCNMGKEPRQGEPEAIQRYCSTLGLPILGKIESPGTLEGGDAAWVDESTLAVGHTYRTNKAGIRQLKEILRPYDLEIITIELPHYRGPSDVFHLMSIFSPVDRDVAVVYSPLMPIAFREELLARSFHLIEVPENEFDSMGCNVLAIAPRHVIVVAGNPLTKTALEMAGCNVQEYVGSEISIKGGGGPTCLTRPLKRRMIDSGFA